MDHPIGDLPNVTATTIYALDRLFRRVATPETRIAMATRNETTETQTEIRRTRSLYLKSIRWVPSGTGTPIRERSAVIVAIGLPSRDAFQLPSFVRATRTKQG
ncbi:MAG TPA: hypothetical protein VK416_03175, partial [Thermoanaerobaculia bacterium]|nr:hypothetical protein [Thermoanaerobaculia bacterium]